MNLPLWHRPAVLLGGVAIAGIASVGVALFTQHRLGMMPCPWCVLQRLIVLAVALAAGLGWLAQGLRLQALRGLLATATLLLAGCGLAAALWQHYVAARSSSCALTFADRFMNATGLNDRWPEVFAAYASCADAKVNLLGLPYEAWSGALFVAFGLAAARAIRPRRR